MVVGVMLVPQDRGRDRDRCKNRADEADGRVCLVCLSTLRRGGCVEGGFGTRKGEGSVCLGKGGWDVWTRLEIMVWKEERKMAGCVV